MINKIVKYQQIYNSLIDRAKGRIIAGYSEKHHIIPRCMGGTDVSSNLVILTAEEHYVAHQLLVKIYPDNRRLLFAVHMMTRSNNKHIRNNKEYSWLRKRRSVAASEFAKGRKRGKYRKTKCRDPYEVSVEITNFLPLASLYTNIKKNIYDSANNVQNIVNCLYIYTK
jgi:hypothetical protein